MRSLITALSLLIVLPATVAAHHSFAVFFDDSRIVELQGQVTSFRFTNPHGIITLDVPAADGMVEQWRIETNAPVVLSRRGWTRQSVRPGDMVQITGWPARDGNRYVRLRTASSMDGRPIGQSFAAGED